MKPSNPASVASLALVFALVSAACSEGGAPTPRGPEGRVAVSVAPLSLSGIGGADYTVTVTSGPGGTGAVVWTKALTSGAYGDGAGSLAYVGPCDANGAKNTVQLELTALYDAQGAEVPTDTYKNPTPVERDADCVANGDTAVDFDLTIARAAQQGFFDVAVELDTVFCAAKLDCLNSDTGGDLELLTRPGTSTRDLTAVMGFACVGPAGETPYLYADDPVVDCGGYTLDARVDAAALGNVPLGTSPSANADGYLFAAAVYRGKQPGDGVAYWNVALGLDEARFLAAGTCVLRGRATASVEAWPQEPDGFAIPADRVYPVVDWAVELSSAAGGGTRSCGTHAVNVADSGVATTYLGYLAAPDQFTWGGGPTYLRHRFEPGTGIVLSATGAICNPGCEHGGGCVGTDECDCALTGYEGDTCETPICAGGCGPGTCVAPETCDCAGTGFKGPGCADDADECAGEDGGASCGANATCQNTVGGYACPCDTGYEGDGSVGCTDIDACDAHGCGVNATCHDLEAPALGDASGRACPCDDGYEGDGAVGCTEIDGCLANPCGDNATCADVLAVDGGGASGRTCACQAGFEGDAAAGCTDIDACVNNPCVAGASCTDLAAPAGDTAAGRTCACDAGFWGDGASCTACASWASLPSTRVWVHDDREGLGAAPTTLFGDAALGVGKIGQGLVFGGTGYAAVADGGRAYVAGSFSVEAWVKTSAAADMTIVSDYECGQTCIGGVANSVFQMRLTNTGNAQFYVRDTAGAVQTVTGTATLSDGEFHHVVGVRDLAAGKLRIYVDGGEDVAADLIVTGALKDDDAEDDDLLIGATYQGGSSNLAVYMIGSIDELAVHAEALDAAAVKGRYEAASAACACAAGEVQDGAGACEELDECAAGADRCDALGSCVDTAGGYTCACGPGGVDQLGNGTVCSYYATCAAVFGAGFHADGVYGIDPDGSGPKAAYLAYCKQELDGGGWTLIYTSSDDATNTFTWSRWPSLMTFRGAVGSVATPNRDLKSLALSDLPFTQLLFLHAPSGVWARYNVNSGAAAFGAFMNAQPASPVCPGAGWSGIHKAAGTLTSAAALNQTPVPPLCDTDLYFNLGDQDGGTSPTACMSVQPYGTGTLGPAWNGGRNGGCNFDDSSLQGTGPQAQCGECDPSVLTTEEIGVGFGSISGLNTGTVGAAENYLQVFVK
ncbi:MAG: hypothetical protein H6745_17740 [Deltaproteobacteria bacterium]|nr:hypothetical protein [Deltaproteobacteria bacterium]